LETTDKEYISECKATGEIIGILEEDVGKICKGLGKTSVFTIGGGVTGFAGGCAIGTALGAPIAGIGALPGCIIGGTLGAIGGGTAGATIGTTMQINCQEEKVPSDVGACIARTKGGDFGAICEFTEGWTFLPEGIRCGGAYVIIIFGGLIAIAFIKKLMEPSGGQRR